jgi:hypothetical protein
MKGAMATPWSCRLGFPESGSSVDREIRQRVVKFLSPEQLSKWDSEIAKAKEFLGQKLTHKLSP